MKKINVFLVLMIIVLLGIGPVDVMCNQNLRIEDGNTGRDEVKIPPWSAVGPGGGYIVSLAFNPKNNKVIYAAMDGHPGSLFRTMNSGKSWKRIASLDGHLNDVAVDPVRPKTLYALSSWSIFKSIDGGKKWKEYSFVGDSSVAAAASYKGMFYTHDGIICINPEDTSTLYVSGYFVKSKLGKRGVGIVKSTDGGKNWNIIEVTPESDDGGATCMALNPIDPSEIYIGGEYSPSYGADAASSYGIFKSNNGGNSWADITGSISEQTNSIVIDKNNPSKVYVCTEYGVYRSSNGGKSWLRDRGEVKAYSLAIDPSNSDILYAGFAYNCYKSVDGGKNWTEHDQGLYGFCTRVIVPFTNDTSVVDKGRLQSSRVYFGGYAGFYRSDDGGLSWKPYNNDMLSLNVHDMSVAASSPNTIYGSVRYLGLLKTTNGGKSWNQMPDFEGSTFLERVIVNPKDANDVFVLAVDCETPYIYRSKDGGKSFQNLLMKEIQDITFNQNDAENIFATALGSPGSSSLKTDSDSSGGMSFYCSYDGGSTWESYKITSKAGNPWHVVVDPTNPSIIYVGGTYGAMKGFMYKSLDGGKNWTEIGDFRRGVHAIAVDPVTPSVVYVGTDDGVFKSVNSGNSWKKPKSSFLVKSIRIRSDNPTTLFAGGGNGVYYSRDSGGTWNNASVGLTPDNVICIDWSLKRKTIYVGTGGGSVFKNRKLLKKIK